MTFLTRALPISIALLILPAVSQSQTGKVWPTFDEKLAKPLLVVADLAPGEYFARPPKSAKCSEPNIVCIDMDPPPFSLMATVHSSVFGGDVQDKIELITTSHYGMGEFEKGLKPFLVKIKTDGQHFMMPRYAKKKLIRNKKDDLYMVIFSGDPIWWLPCSVTDLKEEIFSDEFASSLEIPDDEFGAYGIKKSPEYFRRTATGAIPRYAIAISKLSAHLHQINPTISQMSCDNKQLPAK